MPRLTDCAQQPQRPILTELMARDLLSRKRQLAKARLDFVQHRKQPLGDRINLKKLERFGAVFSVAAVDNNPRNEALDGI